MDLDFGNRGTGRTTRQMEEAPFGAVFIWCNEYLAYPIELARKNCRKDLSIVGPNWLTSQMWRGRKISGIVVDHAAALTQAQLEELTAARYTVTR